MKKLSSKQKIIGTIAVVLVAVIIEIVITTSIVRNNGQVAREGYSAPTAKADSEIISNYIKKGITIGGVTGKLDNIIDYTENDFGKGRENTEYVNNKWNNSSLPWGAHNNSDMWGLIQNEIADGWFVPSKSEWAAFGSEFEITSSNYPTYGLSLRYWSSSQYTAYYAYSAYFGIGYINYADVYFVDSVRLATTF